MKFSTMSLTSAEHARATSGLHAWYLRVQHRSAHVVLLLECFVSFFSVEKGSITVLFHQVSTSKLL